MLSYQHGFHAGNFADVLKHLILVRTLQYLTKKDKPMFYLDTHAAAGSYRLDSQAAQKTGEYKAGIGLLWERTDLPFAAAEYVKLVRAFNGGGRLHRYPGSPRIARQLLRKGDRLGLCELHANELALLKANVVGDRRVRVLKEDGFKACIDLLPPKERRALVMIDPSYEIKRDYEIVVQTVIKAYRRFATGTYALWYPVVERNRIDEMTNALQASGIRNIQLFELGVRPDNNQLGMTASGMIVVNPPWTLMSEMVEVLPYLVEILSEQGFYRIEQLVPE